MIWTYECQNAGCPNFGLRSVWHARKTGLFWEMPSLWCECGFAPRCTDGVAEEGFRRHGDVERSPKQGGHL